MVKAVLQDHQRALLQKERQIATELQTRLAGFEGAEVYASTLRQVTSSLNDLFLLVIVGEFNAGKSACINALLHSNVLEEDVNPTTHQITIMRYGEQNERRLRDHSILEIENPANFLRDISIVDTPGVNAREHERLTKEFVPRSDLILFITSVDRPFTQSERVFMERIRAWGKKVVIILNKIDLLRSPNDLNGVLTFVRENCNNLLGFQPEIFPVSTLLAQKASSAIGREAVELWEKSRFGALESYLFRTLDETERVRLKLLSPLGVMHRLLVQTRASVEQRANLLAEDARTVNTIDEQLRLYREDMENNFAHRLGEIENIILTMRNHGDHFFDKTIRPERIFDLIQGGRIRKEFEQDITADSASRIDQTVQELIDGLVEHEHRLWEDVMEYLDRRRQKSVWRNDVMIGSVLRQFFDYNRHTLLQSLARTVEGVVSTYQQAEAMGLSQGLRNAATQAAIAGASGIGLGVAIIALVRTAAADVSGILVGIALLSFGLYIIPARRKRARQDFDIKMEELRTKLRSAMTEQFHKELTDSLNGLQEAIAPYTHFVRGELKKTATMQEQVNKLGQSVMALKNEIDNL